MLLLLAGSVLLAVAAILLVKDLAWAPTVGILAAPVGGLVGISLIVENLLSPDRSWAPVIAALAITMALVVAVAASGPPRTAPKIVGWTGLALLAIAYVYFLNGDYDERLIVWAFIVDICALAAYSLWLKSPPEISGRLSTKVLAGAFGFLTLSALVGGAQFWYTTQYLPSSEGASLSIESRLRRLGSVAGDDVAKLTLTVTNTSPTQAEILGSVYRVSGAAVEKDSRPDRQMARWLGRPEVRGSTVSRYRRGFSWDLLQAGRIFPGPSRLDPNERFSTSALVYLPRKRFGALREQAEILFAKHASLSLDYADVHRYPLRGPIHGVQVALPIEETSWLRDLTHGNRRLDLDWITATPWDRHLSHFPHLREAVFRDGEKESPSEVAAYNNQVSTLYGIAIAVSKKEIPLLNGG